MSNTQLVILMVTILGSQFGNLLYLSSRIDRLQDTLSEVRERLKGIETLLGVASPKGKVK